MRRIIYAAGLCALLLAVFFSPVELKWPRDLLLPMVMVWIGLCCLWGGAMKDHTRAYERKVGCLVLLLGGAIIGIEFLPVDWRLRIVLVLAVGIPVVAALFREGKKEKRRNQ